MPKQKKELSSLGVSSDFLSLDSEVDELKSSDIGLSQSSRVERIHNQNYAFMGY